MKFLAEHWGDVFSALGFAVALIGFGVTIFMLHRSKTAAVAARDAAREIRSRMEQNLAIADVSKATSLMQEIKRLQRDGEWKTALYRYESLHPILGEVAASQSGLSDNARRLFQSIIKQCRVLERKIEAETTGEKPELDVAQLNEILSKQLVNLGRVSSEIKGRT